MSKKIWGFISINHRLVGIVMMILFFMYFYHAAYIEMRPSTSAPYPVLLISVLFAYWSSIYLIENHDNKWQMYIGYIVLYTFFSVGLFGVFSIYFF